MDFYFTWWIDIAGVGHIVLVDDSICKPCHLGSIFFVSENHAEAKVPLAEAIAAGLREMNPDVKVETRIQVKIARTFFLY